MKKSIVATALFLGLFGFYLHHAAPSVTTGDAGEFMTAAATLSIPHAPSFPLYTLAAKSFLAAVPFGSVPYRCNAFSAFAASGAAALLFLLLTSLGAETTTSCLTALLIGLTTSFWENALVTEVFALNAFFVVLLLLCLFKQRYLLFAFLFGLGMGNHQILLFIVPALVVSVIPAKAGIQVVNMPLNASFRPGPRLSPGRRLPAFAGATGLFLLGLSIYLALPIRSMKEPPLNWGQPTTIDKLYRTMARKDYGSLKLAIGDAPKRDAANAARHMKNFAKQMASEAPLPALLLAVWGLAMGLLRHRRKTAPFFLLFLFSGPFFIWLGNLPFTAQSDGIIGRFLIAPMIALLAMIPWALKNRRWTGPAVLVVCIALALQKNAAHAAAFRSTRLVSDYGRAMLRALPPGAALFMDGGDDAFYSLAMLHYVMKQRSDVALHDRGGLVFKNPYGADFRALPKEEKQKRRWQVEKAAAARGPVFYSTMDLDVLPGAALRQSGFLMQVSGRGDMDWRVIILRSLYPLEPDIYRMRALGCFFPFMRGKQYLSEDRLEEALWYFRRAQQMGPDVDWLVTNLGVDYAHAAYQLLMANRFALSERIYRQWLAFEPMSAQANGNLGVVLERSGRIEEAKAQYRKTAELFPQASDPVFNLAVLAWKAADWPSVVSYLEEVLRRKPDHAQAAGYLKMAREKMGKQ